ncbi:MAG: hypothetical protein E1N59_924 [Puniceicoccaceae bacterium 5H]|nr:MAG: hypothetical protein E1N59_924 [Puniceicoccaceae bacterium 5H]
MLQRFFLWWAHRREAKLRYKLPPHRNQRPFSSSVFVRENTSRFGSRQHNVFERMRARRRMFWRTLGFAGLAFLGWVLWESFAGLGLF